MRQRWARFYGVIVGLVVVVAVVRCGAAADLTARPTATPPIPPLLEVTPMPLAYLLPGRPNLRATLALTPTPGPPRLELVGKFVSGSEFHHVSLSPDGAYLLAGLDRTYTFYDAETFEPLWALDAPKEVAAVGWGLPRRELHLQFEGRIETYDLRNGRQLRTFTAPEITLDAGSFSPDGRLVLIGTPSHFTLVDVVGQQVIGSYRFDAAAYFWQIVWQPDSAGFIYADTYAGVISVCSTGEPGDCRPSPMMAQVADLKWVVPGPDGRLALAGYGRHSDERGREVQVVGVWDVIAGAELAVIEANIDVPQRVEWMPDGRTFSLWYAGRRTLYDAHSGSVIAQFGQGSGRLYITPDRTRIITDYGSRLPGTESPLPVVSLLAWGFGPVLVSPAGPSDLRIVMTSPHTISRWDTYTGHEAHTLVSDFDAQPSEALFSPDGRMVLVKAGGRWIVWPLDDPTHLLPLADSRRAGPVIWLPDSRRIAAGQDGQVVVWEAGRDQPILTLGGSGERIGPLAASPDGHQIAAGTMDGSILIWDVETGERLYTYRATEQIYRLRWSPDGTRLAALLKAGDDAHLLVWQPANGQYVASRSGLHRFVSLEWRSDQELAIIAYPTLWLWNLKTGHARRVDLESPLPVPGLLALLDPNRLLAYSPSEQTIGWWDIASGQLLYSLTLPVNPPDKQDGAIVLGANGSWVAIGRAGEVEIWRITR